MNNYFFILFYAMAGVALSVSLIVLFVVAVFWRQDSEVESHYPAEIDWLLAPDAEI